MKTKLLVYLYTFITVLMLINTISYGEETGLKTEGFTIADEVLLNALAEYDTDANGVLTLEEAALITRLNLKGLEVKSLEGIENLVNLKILEANGCQISSISNIGNMPNLNNLSLSNNNLSSLEGLDKFTNLQNLSVSGNNISSLGDIVNLSNLEYLWIGNSNLSSLEGIEKLTKLKTLYLDDNNLSSLEGIEKLTKLNALYLDNNNLSSLDGVFELNKLTSLSLRDNNISSLDGIKNLQFLKELVIDNNSISSVKELGALKKLEYVYMSNNNVSSLEGINGAAGLKSLIFNNNNISSLEGLHDMQSLKTLELNNNSIKTLEGMANLGSLEIVEINDNDLISLEGIEKVPSLSELYLDGNDIEKLGDISGLNINYITLKNNKLADIDEFVKLLDQGSTCKFFISGNPFYEEAREYFFMNYDTKLSIMGKAGSFAYQKYSPGVMHIDAGAETLYEHDLNLPEYEFEIEDNSIAKLGEKAYFYKKRYESGIQFSTEEKNSANILYSDCIYTIELLSEGKTRMKIICGDFVKYTDIWVVPDGDEEAVLVELNEISDGGFYYLFSILNRTQTGYIPYDNLKKAKMATFNGSRNAVTDFSTLAHFDKLEKIYIKNYSQDLFDKIEGLELAHSLKSIIISESDIADLKFTEKLLSVKELVAANTGIKTIDIAESMPDVKSVDLRGNEISDIDSIKLPSKMEYLYLEGNPLPENAAELLFDKLICPEFISGVYGTIYNLLNIDIVPNEDITYTVNNPLVATGVYGNIKLLNPGNAVLTASYGSVEKNIDITVNSFEVQKGDVNKDTLINAVDALDVLKHCAKLKTFTLEETYYADINGDGAINANDALVMLKIAANVISE